MYFDFSFLSTNPKLRGRLSGVLQIKHIFINNLYQFIIIIFQCVLVALHGMFRSFYIRKRSTEMKILKKFDFRDLIHCKNTKQC